MPASGCELSNEDSDVVPALVAPIMKKLGPWILLVNPPRLHMQTARPFHGKSSVESRPSRIPECTAKWFESRKYMG